MKTVLVASSKGGVGKTTVATHLAAHAALSGHNTVLIDADPQGSSMRWAGRRSPMQSAVLALDGSRRARRAWQSIPADTDQVVVDGAAGAMGRDLETWLDEADAVVVPVLPSTLDLDATVPFLNTLREHPRGRSPTACGPGPTPRSARWTRSRGGPIPPSPNCATARPTWCWWGWARACSTTSRARRASTRKTGVRCCAGWSADGAGHARTDPAAPRPRRAGRAGPVRPGPAAIARRPRRGRGCGALACRTPAGTGLRAVFAGAPHPRDPGDGALGAGLRRPAARG